MATRSPTPSHSYWGSYADPAALAALVGDPRLETGDTAYSESDSTLYAFDGNTSTWAPSTPPATPVTPGGAAGQVQYNGGGFDGAGGVSIDSGDLVLAESLSPTPPTYGSGVKVVAQPLATRDMLVVSTNGYPYFVQPHQGKVRYGAWLPQGNNIVYTSIGVGMPSPSAVGSPQIRNVAATNFVTALRRIGIQPANSGAGLNAGFYGSALLFLRGTTGTMGGFHYVCRFVVSDAGAIASGVGLFVGLVGTTAGLNSAVAAGLGASGVVNTLGLGGDYADSQMHFVYNGASGQAEKVVLNGGTGFPINGQSTDAYELSMWAPPGGNIVYFQVINLTTGVTATGSTSGNPSKLVAQNQLLNPQMMKWAQGGVAASAIYGIDLVSLYIESGY